jgi:hypothetical protein
LPLPSKYSTSALVLVAATRPKRIFRNAGEYGRPRDLSGNAGHAGEESQG